MLHFEKYTEIVKTNFVDMSSSTIYQWN